MYENRKETPPRELIALRATVDPRLIKDSKAVMNTVRQTARTGISQPGATYDSHVEPGRPRSRAKDLGNISRGPRDVALYLHVPELPRRCGHLVNHAALDQHDQDRGHDAGAGVAFSCVVKQLNEWLPRPRAEEAIDVTQAEYQGRADDEERHHVVSYAPGDGYWDDARGVYGLLGCDRHNVSD